MFRPMAVCPQTGAARMKFKKAVYVRCCDIARIVPDASRNAVSRLYRDRNPGNCVKVESNEIVPWGWYVLECEILNFAEFIDDPDRQRQAVESGIRMGIARQRNVARDRVVELELELEEAKRENKLLQNTIAALKDRLAAIPATRPRYRVPMGRRAA